MLPLFSVHVARPHSDPGHLISTRGLFNFHRSGDRAARHTSGNQPPSGLICVPISLSLLSPPFSVLVRARVLYPSPVTLYACQAKPACVSVCQPFSFGPSFRPIHLSRLILDPQPNVRTSLPHRNPSDWSLPVPKSSQPSCRLGPGDVRPYRSWLAGYAPPPHRAEQLGSVDSGLKTGARKDGGVRADENEHLPRYFPLHSSRRSVLPSPEIGRGRFTGRCGGYMYVGVCV